MLQELAQAMKPAPLSKIAKKYPGTPVIQRLGYILNRVLAEEKLAEALFKTLKNKNVSTVLLSAKKARTGEVDKKWNVVKNIEIESDLWSHNDIYSIPYKVENAWFSGECNLTGYELEELLGTKLRALYQRRKGRDLFDLYWAMKNGNVNADKIIRCYQTYMEYSVGKPPTQKQFLSNMEEKMTDKDFNEDVHFILKPGVEYDSTTAWELVRKELAERM